MDEDTARALDDIHERHNRLMASFIVLSGLLQSTQEAVVKIAQKSGIESLDGIAVHRWICAKALKEAENTILAIDDEQLAAYLQEEIERAKKSAGQ